ncbi:MAG: hypothetical protein A2X64_03270 [Ignavibacteria bacterium GWF2_33_9]|nr:MAG: hypothetical protein A2X64_03270 [Ignavibacteria bacterium GWF2_33_9]
MNIELLSTKILSKEILNNNKKAFDIVEYYSNVSSIIERTKIALGKKRNYRLSSSSTNTEKIDNKLYASTH